MRQGTTSTASRVLASYRADEGPLYFIGTFDTGVTVLSQQIRALNLAWCLIETGTVMSIQRNPVGNSKPKRIAIVGGGFAGITLAAGLLEKRANAQLTIFEQRDTLMPLQQGSDSRWLHPHIYDWPSQRSESSAAMLPVLNWTAARASDVVVQVLREWGDVVDRAAKAALPAPQLYCNTRHLRVMPGDNRSTLRVEWVGEERTAADGRQSPDSRLSAVGRLHAFDLVVLAVGFGPERDQATSYWRNETFAQPSLEPARLTYLVSGQGDGAMIDVLRLRISQFRQDRILGELFDGADSLLARFRELHGEFGSSSRRNGMFSAFEELERTHATDFDLVRNRLADRLRRDTDVVLRLRAATFSELFEPGARRRISFQNRILVYLLYKCGGFYPTDETLDRVIADKYRIAPERVIRRHGPDPLKYVESVLSADLRSSIVPRKGRDRRQDDESRWPGGYFGFPGPHADVVDLPDELRAFRREYLPSPTELFGTAFCSSVAGLFVGRHSGKDRLRVTLHRLAMFGSDLVLQQVCDYIGTNSDDKPTAGRTFPTENATIGLAYKCQQIVRSRRGVSSRQLTDAMALLNLNDASRKMAANVGFVAAVPVVAARPHNLRQVTAVLYVDSTAPGFYITNEELVKLTAMATALFSRVGSRKKAGERITNVPLVDAPSGVRSRRLPGRVAHAIELVTSVPPPEANELVFLNLDYSDFLWARNRSNG